MTEPLRLLLGPQRPFVNLNTAIESLNIGDEPIAVVSAAWQEAEGDINDVRHLVSNPLSDLGIYKRAVALFAADKALHDAYRQRQERLQEQQRLYRIRLRQLMIAARRTLRAEGEPVGRRRGAPACHRPTSGTRSSSPSPGQEGTHPI